MKIVFDYEIRFEPDITDYNKSIVVDYWASKDSEFTFSELELLEKYSLEKVELIAILKNNSSCKILHGPLDGRKSLYENQIIATRAMFYISQAVFKNIRLDKNINDI